MKEDQIERARGPGVWKKEEWHPEIWNQDRTVKAFGPCVGRARNDGGVNQQVFEHIGDTTSVQAGSRVYKQKVEPKSSI
jgi:hypothetical protein